MYALSVLNDGIFVTCANPIFPLSDPTTGTFMFEVLEADSSMLKSRIGKLEAYGVDPTKPPFFGKLVRLEPCESQHLSLLYLRHKPTMRAVIATQSEVRQ